MGALNNDNILIEYEKVAEDATSINNCAKNMDVILNNFNDRMTELKRKEIIVGKAADALDENFLSLKRNFDSYIKAVENFSSMISNAANAIKATENKNQKDAENLPN